VASSSSPSQWSTTYTLGASRARPGGLRRGVRDGAKVNPARCVHFRAHHSGNGLLMLSSLLLPR